MPVCIAGRHAQIERIDARFERGQSERAFRQHESARHSRGRRAGNFLRAMDEGGTCKIDDPVGQRCGDDLAPQAMVDQLVGKSRDGGLREIARQFRREIGLVGQFARHDFGIEIELGIGEKHGQFGPRQPAIVGAALPQILVAGQNSTARSSFPRRSRSRMKRPCESRSCVGRARAPRKAPASGRNCPSAHGRRHRRPCLFRSVVACSAGRSPRRSGSAQQNLQIRLHGRTCRRRRNCRWRRC